MYRDPFDITSLVCTRDKSTKNTSYPYLLWFVHSYIVLHSLWPSTTPLLLRPVSFISSDSESFISSQQCKYSYRSFSDRLFHYKLVSVFSLHLNFHYETPSLNPRLFYCRTHFRVFVLIRTQRDCYSSRHATLTHSYLPKDFNELSRY